METSPLATDARGLLRAEGPRAALEQLKKDVRKAPRDPRLRTFLFQLFCVFGEWDRALTQLTVASELDPLALPMATTYRQTIRCEILRERVFAGLRSPTVLGDPGQWLSLLLEANRVLATGAFAQAAELREAAFEAAPTTEGTITALGADGEGGAPKPFAWVADADPRLGPVLEAIFDGKYYWVPFGRLQRVDIEPPVDLRDQIWMPAHFTWSTGGETDGFIPTRYPGSAAAAEDLALSRRTEWRPAGETSGGDDEAPWYLGLGQRMLTTDTDEVPLMDLRRLAITAAPHD
jgi:type VI secretion system protein ImpE